MIGIYKITSPTNKVYIGQSRHINNRFNQYKRLSCEDQPRIYNSLKKHGPDNHSFEVICEFNKDVNQSILDYSEQFFMDAYRVMGIELMNLRDGGSRGAFSDEAKRKLSLVNKGKNTWSKGSKRTELQKQKIKERITKWHHDNGRVPKKRMTKDEFKEYLSKLRKGVCRPQYKGEGNPFYGKKHTEQTKRIISENNKVKLSGPNNGRARAVIQYDLNGNFVREWDTITNASKETGINRLTISSCLVGDNRTAKGYIWKYKL